MASTRRSRSSADDITSLAELGSETLLSELVVIFASSEYLLCSSKSLNGILVLVLIDLVDDVAAAEGGADAASAEVAVALDFECDAVIDSATG